MSDQSSGAWLGHNALRQTLLAYDGLIARTDLSDALLADFNGDPNAIVTFGVAARPGDYGRFAPKVTQAAAQGDTIACTLMKQGAEYLGKALDVLGYQTNDRLCILGGLGVFYEPFLPKALTQNLITPLGTAVDGALQLADRAATQPNWATR